MRSTPLRSALVAAAGCAALSACLGTTGHQVVHFSAAAAGPADARAGQPLSFTTDVGWHVVLTTATVHVGAMYLVETPPSSGGGPSPCVLQGTYVAEVTTDPGSTAGIDVDVLSPAPQYFPRPGQGTDLAALAGQVWLTGVEVDQVPDRTTILKVEGSADRGGVVVPFAGSLTIGQNRVVTPTDATKPGSSPICKERVVSPLPVDLVLRDGGTLLLRVDPRQLFVGIDFSTLSQVSSSPPLYQFADGPTDAASVELYSALHSAGSLYRFSWSDTPL
jgi:hypothetical protein